MYKKKGCSTGEVAVLLIKPIVFLFLFFLTFALPSASLDLRACLHGVGDPGLVGLVSFVFTLWRTQNKRNLPH